MGRRDEVEFDSPVGSDDAEGGVADLETGGREGVDEDVKGWLAWMRAVGLGSKTPLREVEVVGPSGTRKHIFSVYIVSTTILFIIIIQITPTILEYFRKVQNQIFFFAY